jgi:hypothetical protein
MDEVNLHYQHLGQLMRIAVTCPHDVSVTVASGPTQKRAGIFWTRSMRCGVFDIVLFILEKYVVGKLFQLLVSQYTQS